MMPPTTAMPVGASTPRLGAMKAAMLRAVPGKDFSSIKPTPTMILVSQSDTSTRLELISIGVGVPRNRVLLVLPGDVLAAGTPSLVRVSGGATLTVPEGRVRGMPNKNPSNMPLTQKPRLHSRAGTARYCGASAAPAITATIPANKMDNRISGSTSFLRGARAGRLLVLMVSTKAPEFAGNIESGVSRIPYMVGVAAFIIKTGGVMRLIKSKLAAALSLALLAMASDAAAEAEDEGRTVRVSGHYDNAVGTSDAASQGVITTDLIVNRPSLRTGELLEFVPGLIVTQHSGDGKANQYFLRGFNLDHGTDFATSVDGVPVNMPTHGHGQGYSDLNFLIPELVERIEYRKGPYFATHGDFAAAGAADILYKNRLDAPFAQVSVGQNGYRRGVVADTRQLRDDVTLLGAVEWMGNNGPWTVPEGLHRQNAVLRLTQGTRERGSTLSLMAYEARWNSTDQVPQRLIDAGSYNGRPFGRYDSVDPTDGGSTSRYSLSG